MVVVLEFVLSSYCVFVMFVCVFLWLLFLWLPVCSVSFVIGFRVLDRVLCPCGPFFNPETYVLRATPQIGNKDRTSCNQFDLLRSASMGAQPGLQPNISESENTSTRPGQDFMQPPNERAPTHHPHHVITHNPPHQILNMYNKMTIIPHGSLHDASESMLGASYGPCGRFNLPPNQSRHSFLFGNMRVHCRN